MESNRVFNRAGKIGTSGLYISSDGEFFKKTDDHNSHLLEKEYENLKKVRRDTTLKNMEFIEPIEASENGLVTKYVNAKSLIERPVPRLYNEFGESLREFHNSGHVHSHLQFNDVLHDGEKFYLTDLPFLDEEDAIQDLVVPKIGLESFQIKQPWKWRLYRRCFREFLKGYGRIDRSDFEDAYDEALDKRVDNLKSANEDRKQVAKAHVLSVARRIGITGPNTV